MFGASLRGDDTIADALRLQGGAPPQLTVHPFNASLVLDGPERAAARAAAAANADGFTPLRATEGAANGVLNATSAAWERRVREQISKLDAMFALNAVTEEEADTLLARVASGFQWGSTSSMEGTAVGGMERQMSIMSVFPQMNPAAAANAAEAARRDFIPQSQLRQAQHEGGGTAAEPSPLRLHMSFSGGDGSAGPRTGSTGSSECTPHQPPSPTIPLVNNDGAATASGARAAAQKVAFALATMEAPPMQWSDGDEDDDDDNVAGGNAGKEAQQQQRAELDAIVRLTAGPGMAVVVSHDAAGGTKNNNRNITTSLPLKAHLMLEAVADELDYAALRDRLQPRFDGASSHSDTD
jgi:hypothetical protein